MKFRTIFALAAAPVFAATLVAACEKRIEIALPTPPPVPRTIAEATSASIALPPPPLSPEEEEARREEILASGFDKTSCAGETPSRLSWCGFFNDGSWASLALPVHDPEKAYKHVTFLNGMLHGVVDYGPFGPLKPHEEGKCLTLKFKKWSGPREKEWLPGAVELHAELTEEIADIESVTGDPYFYKDPREFYRVHADLAEKPGSGNDVRRGSIGCFLDNHQTDIALIELDNIFTRIAIARVEKYQSLHWALKVRERNAAFPAPGK